MTRHSRWFWAVQLALAVAVGVFVWRAVVRNWSAFRAIDLTLDIRPGWLLLAGLTVWGTYLLLIESWRRVLLGWRQSLGVGVAIRIWTLSNLGRYLPGKVWSLAGMAVLAQRAGVAGWAAGGSALVMQVLAVGTGVAVVAAAAPGAVSGTSLVVGGVVAVGVITVLVRPGPMRALAGLVGRGDLQPLRPAALAAAAAATALGWVGYGVAFLLLARGLLGTPPLGLASSIGVFAAGYITGLVAIFAPGGVGVREFVLVGLLTPAIGSGGAVVLSVGSRLLLTITEAGAALIGAAIGHSHQGTTGQDRD